MQVLDSLDHRHSLWTIWANYLLHWCPGPKIAVWMPGQHILYLQYWINSIFQLAIYICLATPMPVYGLVVPVMQSLMHNRHPLPTANRWYSNRNHTLYLNIGLKMKLLCRSLTPCLWIYYIILLKYWLWILGYFVLLQFCELPPIMIYFRSNCLNHTEHLHCTRVFSSLKMDHWLDLLYLMPFGLKINCISNLFYLWMYFLHLSTCE